MNAIYHIRQNQIKANNKYLLDQQIKFNKDYDHRSGMLKGEYYSSKQMGMYLITYS